MKKILLVNVYGPNKDNPQFYEKLTKKIYEYNINNTICCGDWNLVVDESNDYQNYKHVNNPKAREVVKEMMELLNLTDIWRDNNPEIKRFTWRKQNPFQQARLDYFLLSEYLIWWWEGADILPGYRTDHSMITLTIQFGEKIKRNTFWKFNQKFLRDKKFVDEINEEIGKVIQEYAIDPFDMNDLTEKSMLDIKLKIPDKLFLDFLLMKIRSRSIAYATMKKRNLNEQERFFSERIDTIERKEDKTEQDVVDLRDLNNELEKIREQKMQGVLLRSRAKWVEEGEKITSYFCNLEKRNYISKQMSRLKDSDGNTLRNQKEIKREVKRNFFKQYQENKVEECDFKTLIKNCPKLNEQEIESQEGLLDVEEAEYALSKMDDGKSPGSDGFGPEFFKFFWRVLGPFVVRALNESFKDGELSATQKEGVITCIPKGNKPREFLKNWRPISLLNVVYKIGSACIANRLKKVLPSLIHSDQSGFMTGRYMGDNIRQIYDLINYLNNENLPGMLLCLDFEKAFDCLSWKFLFKVLKYFGFGPDFCKWIDTFYKNIKSVVIVNGQPTEWFPISRGCRQGDPISPYLFIMSVEILAIMIRENELIKGIKINETEHKIAQFADDTQLFNEGDRISFETSFGILDTFENISGLKLNTDKTQSVWLGSKTNSQVRYLRHLKLEWNPLFFKVLGIWLSTNLEECEEKNYKHNFEECNRLFKIWSLRMITPLGRVAVLKSLILSKLIHLWILLPDPPDKTITEMQKACFKFVWENKPDKISRKSAVKSVKEGGINIPDIKTYITALKLTWIRKYNSTKHKWKSIVDKICPFIKTINKYGPMYALNKPVINKFWSNCFTALQIFHNSCQIKSSEDVLAEPMFHNNKFLIGGQIIWESGWFSKGVYCVAHFMNENGRFYNCNEFCDKYNLPKKVLTYNGSVMAIRSVLKRAGIELSNNSVTKEPLALRLVYSVFKGAKLYYNHLLFDNERPNCCAKWENKFSCEIKWKQVFYKIQKIKEIKLKWLQLRIVHRIIGTNIVLKQMGEKENEMCTFCGSERENIQHLFWRCNISNTFWQSLQKLFHEKCQIAERLQFTEKLILFGLDINTVTDHVFDEILLVAKYYLFKCKYDNRLPLLSNFICHLTTHYETLEYNSKIKSNYDVFKNEWMFYTRLLGNG